MNGGHDGGRSFSNGNGPLSPQSWSGGMQGPLDFRSTWDGTFGDPLYAQHG